MALVRSTRDIVVWAEVAEVLARRIEAAIASAAVAPDMRAMGFAQGQLSAFRELLHLPVALVAEGEMRAADATQRAAIRLSHDPTQWAHSDRQRG